MYWHHHLRQNVCIRFRHGIVSLFLGSFGNFLASQLSHRYSGTSASSSLVAFRTVFSCSTLVASNFTSSSLVSTSISSLVPPPTLYPAVVLSTICIWFFLSFWFSPQTLCSMAIVHFKGIVTSPLQMELTNCELRSKLTSSGMSKTCIIS